MKREDLEAIWKEVHPDLGVEGLHAVIITEGIESGGEDPQAISAGLYRLAEDIEQFANAIVERAQGVA
jgi:hypothetical protein